MEVNDETDYKRTEVDLGAEEGIPYLDCSVGYVTASAQIHRLKSKLVETILISKELTMISPF